MGFNDYNVRISTIATVEDPSLGPKNMCLVTLSDIDHDAYVTGYILKKYLKQENYRGNIHAFDHM